MDSGTDAGTVGHVEAVDVVGLLADEDRLAVVAALVLGARSGADIAERTGQTPKRALQALARLESGGLVRRHDDGGWSFETDVLREVMREASPSDVEEDEPNAVLRAFVRSGRLLSIPMQRSKRLVVLDRLAGEFEPGRRYPEAQVNAVLARWYDDVAALRRYLVDEAFLSRDHGVYWRSGGTVDIAVREPV